MSVRVFCVRCGVQVEVAEGASECPRCHSDTLVDPEERLRAMTELATYLVSPALGKPCSGWRWFIDGDRVILEPRSGVIQARDVSFVDMFEQTLEIEIVFRATPRPGVYLRFGVRMLGAGPQETEAKG